MLKLDLSPSMHFFLAFSAKQLLEYAQHGNRCNGGGGILKAERRFGLFNACLWSESHFQCMPFVCSFNPPIGKFDFCASGRQLCPDKGVVLSPEESCPLLIWSNQVSSIHSLEVKQLLVLIAFAFSLSRVQWGENRVTRSYKKVDKFPLALFAWLHLQRVVIMMWITRNFR